jgi:hypothetical protein
MNTNTSEPNRRADAAAFAATHQLFDMQAVAFRELQELNMSAARAAIDALTAWQSLAGAWHAPAASSRASTDLQQLLADYPRRATEICMRASEAWVAACTEQLRFCTEATRAAVEQTARLARR